MPALLFYCTYLSFCTPLSPDHFFFLVHAVVRACLVVCLCLFRALLLSYLSDVSQTLGQLERPGWLVRARDFWLARYVPPSLRSRAFDALMSASLSGGLAGAVTAAVGAATRTGVGGGGRGRFGGYRVPRL